MGAEPSKAYPSPGVDFQARNGVLPANLYQSTPLRMTLFNDLDKWQNVFKFSGVGLGE